MNKSFEIIQRVGVSNESLTEAIKSVVLEAHTEKPVSWFNVLEQRGRVNEKNIIEFQVTVEIGRKLN
ncbi:MAG: dodecin domain-containing protein [Ignavibacteriales bacterium]|nr:MAG: dodecin domain-containing protein [Ignavibacteriales bacterium]